MNNIRLNKLPTLSHPSLHTLRLLLVAALAVVLTGCGQLGQLLSNDQVSDADNDQVVFLGDSIFKNIKP